ncbi:protein-disulfide reductase DsbD domain-containing protein [Celeribacter marinus]|uniref:protein-disulfide reductase DsbD domain-containing protein n=1 Tax=Celeribacter marinus TaxID=1397108 RepID=UPI003F6BAC63
MTHTPLFLRHALAVTAIACFAVTAAPANAADQAQVSVLNGWRMGNGHHMAALRISLADGWHTYWRAPGDAGIPPRFDWSASKNVSGVQVHWPTPDVYAQNDMRYVGYEGEVVLPLEIRPTASGAIHLEGVIEFGVCDDICIPMTAQLRLDLDGTAPQSDYPAITASLNDAPTRITDAKCDAAPIEDGLKVTVTLGVPSLGAREIAVIEHPDAAIWVSEAMTTRKDASTLTAVSELVPPHAKPFMVNRSDLTITVIGNGTAYEARGCTGR